MLHANTSKLPTELRFLHVREGDIIWQDGRVWHCLSANCLASTWVVSISIYPAIIGKFWWFYCILISYNSVNGNMKVLTVVMWHICIPSDSNKSTEWEEMFINHIYKELVYRIHSTTQKDKPTKKWTKGLNRHFSKESIQMARKHMKRCSASLIVREK